MTTESTTLVRSFTDQLSDLGEIPGGDTLEPGRIQWLHGIKQAKTPGVFYIKQSELAATPGAPWQEDDRFDDERGYSAPLLKLAFIGYRSQWFVSDRTAGTFQWLDGYQDGVGAKKNTEYLVMVEGMDDPMVLSVSGKNKAQPVADILRSYEKGLLMQASRLARRALPRWAFWLPIQNRLTKDGKTDYVEAADGSGKTYGSIVTPPALYLPDNPIDALYVGNDVLLRGAQLRDEFSLWFKAKHGSTTVEAEYVVEQTPALPAPRNQPQPITEAELPPWSKADEY